MAPSRRSPLPRTFSLAVLLLLTAGGFGCAGKRTPSPGTAPERRVPSYSASITLSISLAGRGFLASGGCAVVPGEKARVELRDPAGGTRLLLLLDREEGTLIAPVEGLAHTWTEASHELPWGSGELLALFSGSLPGGARPPLGDGPGPVNIRWKNSEGSVKTTLTPATSSPFPFSTAEMVGPHGASLRVTWNSARASTFGEAAFQAPAGIPLVPASPPAILREVRP